MRTKDTENIPGPEMSHKIRIFLSKSISLPARWSTALGTIAWRVLDDCKSPVEDEKGDLDACKKGRREEQNVV